MERGTWSETHTNQQQFKTRTMELEVYELFLNELDEEIGMNLLSVVEEPAHDEEAIQMEKEEIQMASDEERQMLYGAILIPNKKILRIPTDGRPPYYVTFSPDTVRKVAYKFNRDGNLGNIDYDHSRVIEKGVTLVENWIVENPENDKASALGMKTKEGVWFGGTHIPSKDKWNELKKSKRTGFSLDGTMLRKKVAEAPKDPVDLLMEMVDIARLNK